MHRRLVSCARKHQKRKVLDYRMMAKEFDDAIKEDEKERKQLKFT